MPSRIHAIKPVFEWIAYFVSLPFGIIQIILLWRDLESDGDFVLTATLRLECQGVVPCVFGDPQESD